MAKRYAVTGKRTTVGSGLKTALTLIASATVRPRIYHFIVSCPGATADNVLEWVVQRFTATGTTAGSAPTPQAVDPSEVAAIATAGWDHSVEPTYTAGALLFDQGVNQKTTFQWYAYCEDAELVAPATASNGIGFQVLSPGFTGLAAPTIYFNE
jgi:hypothetical protein